jgi:proline iminopeptidase
MSGLLQADPIHRIYYEQCGRADGVPVLFVHGGPGAGCSARDRRFFDPDHFRVVLVDQRGAGRSCPVGELSANTAEHLIRDFERLRESLGIERWHVFGGSWGSTLGLLYAQAHPQRCLSLTLRGIWLFREEDLNWWLYGLRRIQPERWQQFADGVAPERTGDLLNAYWDILTGDDHKAAVAAAHRWSEYEISSCTLLPNDDFLSMFQSDDAAFALARLEAHYFRNNRLQPDDQILQRVQRIRNIPATIIHGRYDLVCPVIAAHELHQAWPEASLQIIEDAGHSSCEPGIEAALVAATDRIRDHGSPT